MQQPNTRHLAPPPRAASRRAGFTLMEINLVLLILGGSLVVLLSQFTVGLRQHLDTTANSSQTAFAAMVFNAMRANAQMVTNWNSATGWCMLTNGVALGVASSSPAGTQITVPTILSPTVAIIGDGLPHKIGNALNDGYLVKGQYMEYELHIENGPSGDIDLVRTVWMRVSARRFTDISKAPVYATAVVYKGM